MYRLALFALMLTFVSSVAAQPPRALPDDQKPDDRRLATLRTTDDSEFPMEPVTDADAWPARRQEIRTRILVAAGLHPMPKRSPLHAIIYGRIERDDYTVERVIFESFPDHYVTGSLYRPKAPTQGKHAAVLCPHGHWEKGRFNNVQLPVSLGPKSITWFLIR
jgi:hypothetical protein